MDQYALVEGAALLSNATNAACLEMAGFGGKFCVEQEGITIALTGAPMTATIDNKPVSWRSSCKLEPGQILNIGSTVNDAGTYGYLHVAGGINIEPEIGAMGTHLRAAVGGLNGKAIAAGDELPVSTVKLPDIAPGRLPEPGYFSTTMYPNCVGAAVHSISTINARQAIGGIV